MKENARTVSIEDLSTVALLDMVLRRFGTEIIDALHAAGFTDARPGHGQVMSHLRDGGIRLVDLAERARMTPQAMGQLVDRLEELGYVERRPDPNDRRAKLICMAARGHAAAQVAMRATAAQEAHLRTILGDAGYQRFREALGALLEG